MAKKHKEVHNEEHVHLERHSKLQLEPKKLGLALGIMKGACMATLAFLALTLGWGSAIIRMLGSLLLGYEVSPLGIVMGLVWGFAGGFAAGYLLAVIYNKLGECSC